MLDFWMIVQPGNQRSKKGHCSLSKLEGWFVSKPSLTKLTFRNHHSNNETPRFRVPPPSRWSTSYQSRLFSFVRPEDIPLQDEVRDPFSTGSTGTTTHHRDPSDTVSLLDSLQRPGRVCMDSDQYTIPKTLVSFSVKSFEEVY